MTIKITKQLATMEDLAIGTGTVVQERNGVPLTLTKIDFVPKSEVVIRVTSIEAMAALTGDEGYQASLSGDKAGVFEFSDLNLSAEVSADPEQYTYIAPSFDATGVSGAWVRQPEAYSGSASGSKAKTLKGAIDDLYGASSATVADAALLDPAAYVYVEGENWSVTVPDGETWYIVNAWHATINDSPKFFHRNLASADFFEVPEGTVLKSSSGSTQSGFIYFCRPALVESDSRYEAPGALISQRQSELKTLPIAHLGVNIPAGSAPGTKSEDSFPTDFEDGFINHVSNFDLAWIILRDATDTNGLNTFFEISDNHQNRVDGSIRTPFVRAVIHKVECRAANVSGNYSELSLEGDGVVSYQKLPDTWRANTIKPYEAEVLALNPVRYYKLDDRSGAVAIDSGSASVNGNYISSPTLGAAGATMDGRPSVYFDGTGQHVQVPAGSDINLGADNWSIEVWVKLKSVPTSAMYDPSLIQAWNNAEDTDVKAFLFAVKSGVFALAVQDTVSTEFSVASTVDLAVNTWYLVIAGREGANIFIRVVGEEAKQNTAIGSGTSLKAPVDGFEIATGFSEGTPNYEANGIFGDVAFYAFAISNAEAESHKEASARNV